MSVLLINADDFGMSDGVVTGILECMQRGTLHTTSAMVCDPDDQRRVRASAGQAPGRIGLHLQLTDGSPLSPPNRIPSLVNENGTFPNRSRDMRTLNPSEVLVEWRAQLNCLRDLGVEPSHLDSHHDVHALPVRWRPIWNLPARQGYPPGVAVP